ncbi:hypothetical protein ACW0TQ_20460 [Oceanobacillus sp. M60]|nr:hypothetical protein [Oceanobacillus oncorhynchi]UUI39294.1 hypothetical protein NP440_18510 [Oceanobacillus oncorhynchi]
MVFGGASNRRPRVKTPQKKSELLFFEEAERKPMESVVFFRSGRINLTTLKITPLMKLIVAAIFNIFYILSYSLKRNFILHLGAE